MAARNLGVDRDEIRRRNFILPSEMPYKTPIGPTYDCGDFPRIFARALALADYEEFRLRRADAMRRGRLPGVRLAFYVESPGIAPPPFSGAAGPPTAFFQAAPHSVEPRR